MSITLMNKAWSTSIPSGTKLVLLSLCDFANADDECFPSVALVAQRCSMSVRAVQVHISSLVDQGLLSRTDRNGHSTLFRLDPRRFCTPADSAPPQILHPSPAESAPPTPAESAPITTNEPPHNLNTNTRAQGSSRRAVMASSIFGVDDVDPQVWQDFVTLRKSKRAPLTKTAVDGLRREAEKAGWSLGTALRECCDRGWVGFKADWVRNERRAAGAGVVQSFKAQDDAQARARWSAMTGQPHPEDVARSVCSANVIDASAQFARIAL